MKAGLDPADVCASLPYRWLCLDPSGRVLAAGGMSTLPASWPVAPVGARLDLLLPSGAARQLRDALHSAAGAEGVTTVEIEAGLGCHVEARLAPAGQSAAVVVLRDVTAQRRAERAAAAQLAALRRANAELDRFAATVAHDLQEPLRTIAGFLRLLERRYGDGIDPDARNHVAHAVDGARRLQSLIQDLLELSRVGSRGRPLERVDGTTLVAGVREGLAATLAATGGEIVLGPLPELLADRSQLQRLLANLVGNALKFRGEAPPRVEITATDAGDAWLIDVADNGIGIDPAQHEAIFRPLHRLHPRSTHPGNGLGLALCRRIAERHGGTLTVDSTPGRGSRFRLTLPKHGRAFPDDEGLV